MPTPPLTPAADLATAIAEWRTAHPQATLAEIEHAVDEHLSTYRAALITAAATQPEDSVPADGPRPTCPDCGQPLQRVGPRRRQLTTAQDGQVVLTEPGYRCPVCGTGGFPPQ